MNEDEQVTADKARLREIIGAYGADMARWPAEKCEKARDLLLRAPELEAELEEARALDAFLDSAPNIEPSAELQAAIMAAAPVGAHVSMRNGNDRSMRIRIDRALSAVALLLSPAGALGASAAAGLAAGFLLGAMSATIDPLTPEEEMASYIAESLNFDFAELGEDDDA